MTPESAFRSKGRNPKTGVWVRDWYALGCVFAQDHVMYEGEALFGIRILACSDVASQYMMHFIMLPRQPDAVRAEDIIKCFGECISKHGPPRMGVIVSHSVWQSSAEMLLDEDTAPQGEFLKDHEIEFGPMAYEEKQAVENWAREQGFHCEFNGDNINDYAKD